METEFKNFFYFPRKHSKTLEQKILVCNVIFRSRIFHIIFQSFIIDVEMAWSVLFEKSLFKMMGLRNWIGAPKLSLTF